MKNRWRWVGGVLFLCCLTGIFLILAQKEDEGFVVIDINGNEAFYIEKSELKSLEKGKFYPYGTQLKTGRDTTIDILFSPENVCRLMPRTQLTIIQHIRNPKLKQISLEKGKVVIKLDNWPAGHQLRVETPSAVCGALGTRFTITFEDDEDSSKKASREMSASCEKGSIYAKSRFLVKGIEQEGKTFNVQEIKENTEIVAKVHEGLENAYTDIEVKRGNLRIDYGVKGEAKLETNGPSRFICALPKSDEPVIGMVVEVKRGSIFERRETGFLIKSEEITTLEESNKPILITQGKVFEPVTAETIAKEYLAATQQEGERYSLLISEGRDPTQDPLLRELSTKATQLRQQLFSEQMLRTMRHIRSGARRSNQGIPRR